MHWLDRIASAIVHPQPRHRIFHGGWGDPGLLAKYRERVQRGVPDELDLDVAWEQRANGALPQFDGTYVSPGQDLPERVRFARVRMVLPQGECRRLCLLMPAWNDNTFASRGVLARRLAREGIGTIMMEAPFFGHRHPRPGHGHPIQTVADFPIMGAACVEEGRALLAAIERDGLRVVGRDERPVLGVAGYSMGGNIGSFISAMSPYPLATAPLAASPTPSHVFVRGLMRAAVDWEALGEADDPEGELEEYLGHVDVRHHPPADHSRHAVIVGGRGDGFVEAHLVEALHRHWPGSELRWTNEGHATLAFLRRPMLARAIIRAFDRLEAATN